MRGDQRCVMAFVQGDSKGVLKGGQGRDCDNDM